LRCVMLRHFASRVPAANQAKFTPNRVIARVNRVGRGVLFESDLPYPLWQFHDGSEGELESHTVRAIRT